MAREFFPNGEEELLRLERLGREGIACTPSPNFLATFVRFQRAMRGWKQDTLASFAQVSLSTVQRIERGEQVSANCLDQVAVALGYPSGSFTEPRVPLTRDTMAEKLEEWLAPYDGKVSVPVKPLRNQSQVAKLARCELYLVDGGRIGEECQGEIDALTETLDFVAYCLSTEEEGSFVSSGRREPVKRRELYAMVLDQVRGIERRYNAVALAGTYQVETGVKIMPLADAAVVGFFPKASDPGAIKRPFVLAPDTVDFLGAIERDTL